MLRKLWMNSTRAVEKPLRIGPELLGFLPKSEIC
jgi:hypothetical protein